MIESLLHFIGICPDHVMHIDLIDYIAYNWTQVVDTMKFLKAKFAI